MNRTALHLACANGHAEVVTLLVQRKCQVNFYDSEHRTALMKAVQCEEGKCVSTLLQHGADPDVTDASGNTAFHYAVCAQHVPIAVKLLSYNANTEARNKDDFTPLLLAVNENKDKMVGFLVKKVVQKKEANIHAVHKAKSSRQLISEYKEEKLHMNSSQNNNPGKEEHSEEDSLSRFSNKPDIDDSWPTSDEDYNFDTKWQQELEKNITRELQEATAELESGCYRVSLRSTEDLVLKTSQEYTYDLKDK